MDRIDLNCDLGEGAGHDAELMPFITSANIACGGHAGDAGSMRTAVGLALAHGVAIGAHPGLEDRANFGRRELPLAPAEARELVASQVAALAAVARQAGARLAHVKPHGALYNLAARDAALAGAVADAVWQSGPELVVFGLAGSRLLDAARARGLRTASEVFADRTYQRDGSLTPRSRADALVQEEDDAVAQVLRMAREGRVRTVDGIDVAVRAETVCVHGDGPQAVAFARRLRAELERAGIVLAPPG